jgi:hypothetical protein
LLLLLVPTLLIEVVQTASLCLLCLFLRSQRFRLALLERVATPQAISPAGTSATRSIQFGVGDLLLWTTALAPLLAISRFQPWRMLTEGILYAIVLMVALWAALGEGPAWLRWSLLSLAALVAGLILAQVEWFDLRRFSATPQFWNWQFIWDWQWPTIAAYFLAAGMLAATLLIFRTLGYRLCRVSR